MNSYVQSLSLVSRFWNLFSSTYNFLDQFLFSFLSVQEQQITDLSRMPSSWVHGNNALKQQVGETFAYLPSALNFEKLCYPQMPYMFTDIEVHRLCLLVGE